MNRNQINKVIELYNFNWLCVVLISSSVICIKQDFSLLHSVQASSGTHPASYPMGTVSPGIKRQGREADHSPSSARFKNGGATPSFPDTSSWRGA
jgi:hypothetical protein